MKLIGSTKSKIRNENCENVHHLKVIEVELIHCHIINNNYQYGLMIKFLIL